MWLRELSVRSIFFASIALMLWILCCLVLFTNHFINRSFTFLGLVSDMTIIGYTKRRIILVICETFQIIKYYDHNWANSMAPTTYKKTYDKTMYILYYSSNDTSTLVIRITRFDWVAYFCNGNRRNYFRCQYFFYILILEMFRCERTWVKCN